MLFIALILYVITLIICFFLTREVVKHEKFKDGEDLLILLIALFVPIINVIFSVSSYLDVKDIEIDYGYIIKKIFFIKDGE